MIQPAAPALVPLLAAPPSPSGVGGEGGAFALSLADFLDAGQASGPAIPGGIEAGDKRQGDADNGNILQDATDPAVLTADPALAWLVHPMIMPEARPIAFIPRATVAGPIGAAAIPAQPTFDIGDPSPAETAVATVEPSSAVPSEPAGTAPPPEMTTPGSKTMLAPVTPSVLALIAAAKAIVLPASQGLAARVAPAALLPGGAAPATIGGPVSAPTPVAMAVGQPIAQTPGSSDPLADVDAAPQAATLPERAQKATAASPIPTPVPDATTPQPATVTATLAGTVLSVALKDRPVPAARRDDEPAPAQIAATPAQVRGVAVTATGDTQNATLDLSQQRWTHTIIDRIERMRDGIDAADTRIRVVPDALGSIDVSVRKDGDTLHVHFAAEQAATRAILQDAQPRLAEIAEARGLKLGQSGVGAGNGEANRQPPQPQQSQSQRPAPVLARANQPTNDRLA